MRKARAYCHTNDKASRLRLSLRRQSVPKSSALFALSAGIYFGFGLILTLAINVPMNEALAAVTVPDDVENARQIRLDYSPPWQFWNQARTIASGLSLLVAVLGVIYQPDRVKP